MPVLTDIKIAELLACPKVVIDASHRVMKIDGAQRRADLKLESIDGENKFTVFVRQSTEFPENFTIGLKYDPKDGTDSIILMRCNGPHGPFDGVTINNHHARPHIHVATEDNLKIGARAERGAQITDEYTQLSEAVYSFVRRVNFPSDEVVKCFPMSAPTTLPLFEESE